MKQQLDIRAFQDAAPVHLSVAAPAETPDGDFYCVVNADPFFSEGKRIFGVDARQAYSLSVKFLKSTFADKRLVDQFGDEINWDAQEL